MPIPKEILQVERPSSTRVKKFGDRYLVIKRTSKELVTAQFLLSLEQSVKLSTDVISNSANRPDEKVMR